MNPLTTEPTTNQEAQSKMSQAQLELAIALQLFQQAKYYIGRSLESVNTASAVSINKNCTQYQVIQSRLSSAYQELLEGMQIVAVPFEHPPLSTLIELGSQSLRQREPF